MCQNAQTNKEQKSPRSLTKNSIPSLSYECIIFTGSYSLVSAFCLISVLIFIMIFYRRAWAGGSWRAACCFWLFSSLSSGFKIWIWIFMIENNRGYKNKSLQSWAVSYRGKQCLPHQRSLKTLASSLMPVKAHSSSAQPRTECSSAELASSKKCQSLSECAQALKIEWFSLRQTQNKRKHFYFIFLPSGWDRLTRFKT